MANKSTGIYGHFGDFSAVAELPNTAGAAVQTSELQVGDVASVAGGLYICSVATLGGATWVGVGGAGAGSGQTAKYIVGNEVAGDDESVCDFLDPGDGTGIAAALAAAVAVPGDVHIRTGTYDFSQVTSPALPLAVPSGMAIRGASNSYSASTGTFQPGGTQLIVGDDRNLFTVSDGTLITDLTVSLNDIVGTAVGTSLFDLANGGNGADTAFERVTVTMPPGGGTSAETLTGVWGSAEAVRLRMVDCNVIGIYANVGAGGIKLWVINLPDLNARVDMVRGVFFLTDAFILCTDVRVTDVEATVTLEILAADKTGGAGGTIRLVDSRLATTSNNTVIGIDILDVGDIYIRGNNIGGQGFFTYGISVDNAATVFISENFIKGVTAGVLIDADTADSIVTDNRIFSSGTSRTVETASLTTVVSGNVPLDPSILATDEVRAGGAVAPGTTNIFLVLDEDNKRQFTYTSGTGTWTYTGPSNLRFRFRCNTTYEVDGGAATAGIVQRFDVNSGTLVGATGISLVNTAVCTLVSEHERVLTNGDTIQPEVVNAGAGSILVTNATLLIERV